MSLHLQGIRTALLGAAVNLFLAGVKIAGGVWGQSYALIADGIESAADVVSSLVVITGLHVSARPADANHPYGHGKAEALAGVVVASLLLIAGGWIAWSSVAEIRNPHHAPAPFTLIVLAAVVLVKEALSRFVLRVGDALDSVAVRGDAWHHRSDALTSAAAFLGISVALIGGPGFEAADDWAALSACVVILLNGARFLRESVNVLMDASAAPELVEEVREIAGSVEGVLEIEKCRVRKIGLEWSMDIHVVVDGDWSVRRGHEVAHAVKDRLLGSGHRITDVTVHIEPGEAAGPEAATGDDTPSPAAEGDPGSPEATAPDR